VPTINTPRNNQDESVQGMALAKSSLEQFNEFAGSAGVSPANEREARNMNVE
jgi:hypothetical protein